MNLFTVAQTQTKTLKLNKKFWSLIVSGKKKYEFRKLSEGITNGWYKVMDMKTGEHLGSIELIPLTLNPTIFRYQNKDGKIYFHDEDKNTHFVDWDSSEFVRENYASYNNTHNFVAYEIENIKDGKHA